MHTISRTIALGICIILTAMESVDVNAQDEIDYLERFAFSDDRRDVLSELIPGTEDFFYYHCLHYQNQGQLSEAEAVLKQWRTRLGETDSVVGMTDRQRLLTFGESPWRTADYLTQRLRLNFAAAAPQRRGESSYPNRLEENALDPERLTRKALQRSPDLTTLEDDALPGLLDDTLSPEQLRAVLKRISYAGYPKLLERIVEELKLRDSKGFGWTRLHQLLTREQLDALQVALPAMNGNREFALAYLQRLRPSAAADWSSQEVQSEYLQRVWAWAEKLPDAQRDLRAVAACNLLRFNLTVGRYDQQLLKRYLEMPRNALYYRGDLKRTQRNRLVDTRFAPPTQSGLRPIDQDEELIRSHLEHFIVEGGTTDEFASWIDQKYLEQLEAKTKILYGIGDPAIWYPRLGPAEQKELKQRVEIQFQRGNRLRFDVGEPFQFDLEVKNLDELIVRVYEIDTAEYYRQNKGQVRTDVNLDGLVPNLEKRFEFDLPSDRRHAVQVDLTNELSESKRGVWVVDCVGGGLRSRAVLRRGELLVVQRVTDLGHRFQIMGEDGSRIEDAEIEIAGRRFAAEDGDVFVPFAERRQNRVAVAIAAGFASTLEFTHQKEQYSLDANVLLPRQSLISERTAAIVLQPDLRCVGRRASLDLLEDCRLTINAVDANGVAAELVSRDVDLADSQDLTATFVVPRRLRSLSMTLTATVFNQSKQLRETIAYTEQLRCNELEDSLQIAQFYVQRLVSGTRAMLLGRNGEAQALVPVRVEMKHRLLKQKLMFNLATDENGILEFGDLSDIEKVTLQANEIRPWSFVPGSNGPNWPSEICLAAGQQLSLALGTAERPVSDFALWETRGTAPHTNHSATIQITDGAILVDALKEGDYVLADLRNRVQVDITIVGSESKGELLVGASRVADASSTQPVVIRSARIEGGRLRVQVDGADELARVHIVANAFMTQDAAAAWTGPSGPKPTRYQRRKQGNVYLEALRLDEEYSYVLNRQSGETRFGNMLPQPGLLLHPWEVNDTKNQSQTAMGGDALPNEMADAAMAAPGSVRQSRQASGTSNSWMAFNFLNQGSYILANAPVTEGVAEIELDELTGISELVVLIADGESADSRTVPLDEFELVTRDLRLSGALEAAKSHAQSQTVRLITKDQSVSFVRENVMEVNAYRSLQDVYRLYATLLPADWQKLDFVPRWAKLSDEEKRSYYNSYACHEMNLFVYRKDHAFFQEVVRPTIAHKLEKQFVDHWLLGDSLEEYKSFTTLQRLNVLERILLAQRHPEVRSQVESFLRDQTSANEDRWAANLLFEAALRQASRDGTDGKQDAGVGVDFEMRMFGENAADGLEGEAEMEFGRGLARGRRGPAKPKAEAPTRLSERLGRARKKAKSLYRSVDKTREWAESQYYRLPIQKQNAAMIPVSEFWSDYMQFATQNSEDETFLPKHLELSCHNINEAFAALALIDLPFEPGEWAAEQQEGRTVITGTDSVLYLKTIEEVQSKVDSGIVVGRNNYFANADLSKANGQASPVDTFKFQSGVPYRALTIVTNPTPMPREFQLLTQIPAGAIALEGRLPLTNSPINVQPYGTEKVEFTFYFPEEGVFSFAGARVNDQSVSLRKTETQELHVSAEPTRSDLKSWEEIASWGTTSQVLERLGAVDLSDLDLGLLAFRMGDKDAYEAIIAALEERMHYEGLLWKFSVIHQDQKRMATFLAQQFEFVGGLGGVLNADVCPVDERNELRFEHLDYKPLVSARTHLLGQQRRILNDGLSKQYKHLLQFLAHKPSLSGEEKLQVAYYLYLQNRIEEADQWLGELNDARVAARPQLDYLKSNVDFMLGRFEDAVTRSQQYEDYPLPRWRQLFQEVRSHYEEFQSASMGTNVSKEPVRSSDIRTDKDESQNILTDARGARQTELAKQSPAVSLMNKGGAIHARYTNLESLTVRFFQMDIELLFSRTPFRVQTRSGRPLIRPNEQQQIALSQATGSIELQVPEAMQGKNVLVEVSGAGASDSIVFTAGDLDVEVSERMGQVRVVAGQGRAAVGGAYVKVYAEHRGGEVRFFKDGYTDLRGRFDYATLSTDELDSVIRFAILILDPDRGATVKEAKPPLR